MNRIAELRKEKGLTQKELGRIFSCAETTIANYENERTDPGNKLLLQFSKYFNVSTDYLLGRSNSILPPPDEEIDDLSEEQKLKIKLINEINHLPTENLKLIYDLTKKLK